MNSFFFGTFHSPLLAFVKLIFVNKNSLRVPILQEAQRNRMTHKITGEKKKCQALIQSSGESRLSCRDTEGPASHALLKHHPSGVRCSGKHREVLFLLAVARRMGSNMNSLRNPNTEVVSEPVFPGNSFVAILKEIERTCQVI